MIKNGIRIQYFFDEKKNEDEEESKTIIYFCIFSLANDIKMQKKEKDFVSKK